MPVQQEFGEAQHDAHRVVDLMGHPGGQGAQGGQFLGLGQLLFQLLAVGEVPGHDQDLLHRTAVFPEDRHKVNGKPIGALPEADGLLDFDAAAAAEDLRHRPQHGADGLRVERVGQVLALQAHRRDAQDPGRGIVGAEEAPGLIQQEDEVPGVLHHRLVLLLAAAQVGGGAVHLLLQLHGPARVHSR